MAEGRYSAGDLRSKVRFDVRVTTDDGMGNQLSEWATQFTRRAFVQPLKGGESVIAARLTGVGPALIVVRWDSKTKLITNEFRAVELRDDGEEIIYAIRDARDMEKRKRFCTLLVEQGAPA
jgi:SPP1 family predicted phage head-tail adaptor